MFSIWLFYILDQHARRQFESLFLKDFKNCICLATGMTLKIFTYTFLEEFDLSLDWIGYNLTVSISLKWYKWKPFVWRAQLFEQVCILLTIDIIISLVFDKTWHIYEWLMLATTWSSDAILRNFLFLPIQTYCAGIADWLFHKKFEMFLQPPFCVDTTHF